MLIRPGTRGDVEAIDAFDPFGGERGAEVADGRLFVAESDAGQVRGYVAFGPADFQGYPFVTFLCIHPDCRREGVGMRLLEHAESLHPGRRLFISTEADNPAMLALLEKRGYTRSGALAGMNDDHSGADEVFFYKSMEGPPGRRA